MSEAEMAMQALDELPDEVLLRVLAGAGSKAILRTSACCRRLRGLARMLQLYRCFSAAASTKSDLGDALAEACDRALQGMLGCVDFALVFVANHDKHRAALPSQVVEGLLPRLPPGTPVVGCATSGLMGVGPGGAFELDPAGGGPRGARGAGVALLLGRMPGCCVRPFCNLPPSPPGPGRSAAAAAKRGAHGPGGIRALAGSRKAEAANTAAIDWLTGTAAGAGAGAEGNNGTAGRAPAAAAGAAVASGAAAAAAATAAATGGPAEAEAEGAAVRPSARALGLQSVWLLMAGSNAAFELLDGPGGLLQWLQADERARPVIAGGVSSGRGDLFFHPGRRPPPASGPATPPPVAPAGEAGERGSAAELQPMAEAAAEAAGGASGSGGGGGGGRRSRRSSRSGASASAASASAASTVAAAAADADVWDSTVKGIQYVGLAVMVGEPPAVHAARGGGAAAAAAAAAAAGKQSFRSEAAAVDAAGQPPVAAAAVEASLPAVRACALAMRGCAGLPGQAVFERVAIARELLSRRRRQQQQQQAAAEEEEDGSDSDSDEDDEDAELVTVSGGVSVSGGGASLVQELREVVCRTRTVPHLAVWLAERGDASLSGGLDVRVFRSGKMVMGQVDPQLLALYGIVAFRTSDAAALDAISGGAAAAAAGSGSVLCCQLADITPQGCRLHLQAELPVLRSVASPYPLLPGGRPDPRHWEGYAVVRRAALRAGARAGPVAMAVFSCTGRGRAIFGEASAECEARIADEVLQQGVPFVGAYCNGELGPYVRHAYAGWFFNPLCVQPPDTAAASVAAVAASSTAARAAAAASAGEGRESAAEGSASRYGGDGGGGCGPRHTVVAGGRVLPLDRTQMQGFTSVYAALG